MGVISIEIGGVMAEPGCATCSFRRRYNEAPGSLLGRLWRWHAGWCPGWTAYMRTLPQEEQRALAERYRLKRHLRRLGNARS